MSQADTLPKQDNSHHTIATPLTQEEIIAAQAETGDVQDNKKKKVPIIPVPDDAPACNFALPDIGKPSTLYAYHDAKSQLLGHIARFEYKNTETGELQKKILPVCYCELPNSKRAWRSAGLPKPRPLYNLPEILARSDAPILVGEGEKVAEAGKLLFPDYVCTTPMHGAQSPQHTDWSPVAGRTVVITTDYDDAGNQFGDSVYDLCIAAGAERVLHMPIEELAKYSWEDDKPVRSDIQIEPGYDIADLLVDDWTERKVATIANLINLPIPYIKQEELQALQQGLSGTFRLTKRGVEYAKEVKDQDGNTCIEWRWFCSYLAVTHQTRDTQGQNWGRILELIDNDGVHKEYVMPMALLAILQLLSPT